MWTSWSTIVEGCINNRDTKHICVTIKLINMYSTLEADA